MLYSARYNETKEKTLLDYLPRCPSIHVQGYQYLDFALQASVVYYFCKILGQSLWVLNKFLIADFRLRTHTFGYMVHSTYML